MENLSDLRQTNKDSALIRELSAPYVAAIRKETKDKIEGHDRSLDIVFDEINK